MQEFWKVILWSFRALQAGTWPVKDWNGDYYPVGSDGHDKADHDHSTAVLIDLPGLHWITAETDIDSLRPADWRSTPRAPHERPPRA